MQDDDVKYPIHTHLIHTASGSHCYVDSWSKSLNQSSGQLDLRYHISCRGFGTMWYNVSEQEVDQHFTVDNDPLSLQQVIKHMTANIRTIQGIDSFPITVKIDDIKVGTVKADCNHVFADYLGLNDSFRYCTKCDKKER